MRDNDHGYKLLFNNAELVRDLLQGFVEEDWIEALDFASLEKVASSFVADDLREREDDVIWRVRCRDSWIYIYILIEFQSTVDRFMAVRLMTYIGLLYQDLIRSGQCKGSQKLPPVFPLVLYNGSRKWTGATAIEDLIESVPGGLSKYRPTLSYLLLDESRHALQGVSADNLVAAIFRLERSKTPSDVQELVQQLISWLKAPEQDTLRRSFAIWISRVLLPVRASEQPLSKVTDLIEVDAMLAERVKEWTTEWKQEGIEEGMQKGRQEGMQKGMQKGEAGILLRLMCLKFGELDAGTVSRVETADETQLLAWSERILSAEKLGDIFQ